jgi:PKD domain
MEGYLAHKWGVASNLALSHPHKISAPTFPGAITTLDGTASDPESNPLTYTWTLVSGPASVAFANAAAIDTTATFTAAGTYTLRLTANDGSGSASDEITITVITPPAPYTAWAQQTWTNPFTLTYYTDNPDGDNLNNLQEFAFGTDPTIGGQTLTYTPGGAVSSGGPPIAMNLAVGAGVDYRAIFTRRKNHAAAGLTYTVQFSADMSNWVNSADTPTVLTGDSTQNPGNIEAVSVPYPFFVPVTGGYKKPTFFRVTVSMP